MFKQPSGHRSQRNQGIKVKHVVQISLFLGIGFWLLYQAQQSRDKKVSITTVQDVGEKIKLGRKDIQPTPQNDEMVNDTRDGLDDGGDQTQRSEAARKEADEGKESDSGSSKTEESEEQAKEKNGDKEGGEENKIEESVDNNKQGESGENENTGDSKESKSADENEDKESKSENREGVETRESNESKEEETKEENDRVESKAPAQSPTENQQGDEDKSVHREESNLKQAQNSKELKLSIGRSSSKDGNAGNTAESPQIDNPNANGEEKSSGQIQNSNSDEVQSTDATSKEGNDHGDSKNNHTSSSSGTPPTIEQESHNNKFVKEPKGETAAANEKLELNSNGEKNADAENKGSDNSPNNIQSGAVEQKAESQPPQGMENRSETTAKNKSNLTELQKSNYNNETEDKTTSFGDSNGTSSSVQVSFNSMPQQVTETTAEAGTQLKNPDATVK